ncbi:thioredoxin family protein [Lutibacter sp.]
MKKIPILALLLFSLSITAQEINWMTLEQAVEAQKTAPKKIFMDAYTTWCGPCKMLDKNTFRNKDVVDYVNKNYYAVKFNAEGNEIINFKGTTYTNPNFNPNTSGRNSSHQLSTYLGVRAYPTIIYLDEQANLIAPITGYKTPSQLELFLKLFAFDDFKKLTSDGDWKNYQANFKSEFKD